MRAHVMDGIRASDGTLVLFKKVKLASQEVEIASFLSSEELRKDPRNHCVSILDVIADDKDSTDCFLVMPFLRWIDDPEFDTVGTILDCVEQLLEVRHLAFGWYAFDSSPYATVQGLVFLHEHNVAHR